MPGRIYTEIVTVNGISIYSGTGNPNGSLQATRGSLYADDSASGWLYRNTNGATSWALYPGPGPGFELWVSGSATVVGATNGSEYLPFATMAAAMAIIAAAAPGTSWIVHVSPGALSANFTVPSGRKIFVDCSGVSPMPNMSGANITWMCTGSDTSSLGFRNVYTGPLLITDDGGVPATSSGLVFEQCKVSSVGMTPGSTSIVDCRVSGFTRVGDVVGPFSITADLTCYDVTFNSTISCRTGNFIECSFDANITSTRGAGGSLTFDTCTWTAATVLTASFVGTVTLDPWSQRKFTVAGGTLVNFSFANAQWDGYIQHAGSLEVGKMFLLSGVVATALAGVNNDFAGLPTTASVSRIGAAAPGASITGLASGGVARLALLINAGTVNSVSLVNESGLSTAANRLALDNNANHTLNPNGCALLYFDTTTNRWRMIGASSGAAGGASGGLTQEYWVDGGTSGTPNGSAITPWAAVQTAIDAAEATAFDDWIINVVPGVYAEAISIPAGMNFTFRSGGAEMCSFGTSIEIVVDGAESDAVITFDGLTLADVLFSDGVMPGLVTVRANACLSSDWGMTPGDTSEPDLYFSGTNPVPSVLDSAVLGIIDVLGLVVANNTLFLGAIDCIQISLFGCYTQSDLITKTGVTQGQISNSYVDSDISFEDAAVGTMFIDPASWGSWKSNTHTITNGTFFFGMSAAPVGAMVLSVDIPISGAGGNATFTSKVLAPATAKVLETRIDKSVVFSGGTPAIAVGRAGSTSLYFATGENDPTSLTMDVKPQETTVGVESVFLVTVSGVPTAGTGVVTVFYSVAAT